MGAITSETIDLFHIGKDGAIKGRLDKGIPLKENYCGAQPLGGGHLPPNPPPGKGHGIPPLEILLQTVLKYTNPNLTHMVSRICGRWAPRAGAKQIFVSVCAWWMRL